MPEGDPSQSRFEFSAFIPRVSPRIVGALAATAVAALPMAATEAHAPIHKTPPSPENFSPSNIQNDSYPRVASSKEIKSNEDSTPIEQAQKLNKDNTRKFKTAKKTNATLESEIPDEKDCTSIRTMKDGIYLGKACLSRGDSYTPVGEQDFKEWSYSLVRLKQDGVYKCGYVRPVLKTPIPKDDVTENIQEGANFCAERQDSIKRRSKYFEDHNSQTTKSGKDKAKDGSSVRIEDDCDGVDKRTYANFTPVARLESNYRKHILNVFGTRVENSFSFVISNNEDKKSLLYRRKIKQAGTSKGKRVIAAIVRTDAVEEELGWGFTDAGCLKEETIETHG